MLEMHLLQRCLLWSPSRDTGTGRRKPPTRAESAPQGRQGAGQHSEETQQGGRGRSTQHRHRPPAPPLPTTLGDEKESGAAVPKAPSLCFPRGVLQGAAPPAAGAAVPGGRTVCPVRCADAIAPAQPFPPRSHSPRRSWGSGRWWQRPHAPACLFSPPARIPITPRRKRVLSPLFQPPESPAASRGICSALAPEGDAAAPAAAGAALCSTPSGHWQSIPMKQLHHPGCSLKPNEAKRLFNGHNPGPHTSPSRSDFVQRSLKAPTGERG